MNKGKKLGICMDSVNANLMEFNPEKIETNTISSDFTHEDKMTSISKSENLMHNKEQHLQAGYYKKLGEVILNYEDVILFGPTDAKAELYNSLRKDHRFEKIKIEVIQSDKMSENQQHAFVKKHFAIC